MVRYMFSSKENVPVLLLKDDTVTAKHLYPLHSHRAFEISIIKQGTGNYLINDRIYDYEKGDVFVIGNRDRHQLQPSEKFPTQNLTVHFAPEYISLPFETDIDASFLSIFYNQNDRYSHRLDRDNPSTEKIYKNVFKIFCEAEHKLPAYHLKIKVYLEHILIEILRNYDYFEINPSLYSKSLSQAKMYEVLEYINYNISEDLTLSKLAGIACVSPTYFSALFRQINNIGLFEYIARKRIDYAANLLRHSDLNITDIAFRCGYNSTGSFNKSFRRIMHCSPSDFRKSTLTSETTPLIDEDQHFSFDAFDLSNGTDE